MSEVILTGMLYLYPGVCQEGRFCPHARFSGKSIITGVGITLSRSVSKGLLHLNQRASRSGYLRFFCLCSQKNINLNHSDGYFGVYALFMKYSVLELHHHDSKQSMPWDRFLPESVTMDSIESKAVFQSGEYKRIFDKKFSDNPKMLSVVKISFVSNRTHCKRTIWREFNSIGISNLKSNFLGLPYNSLYELGITKKDLEDDCYVDVKKGSILLFYWNHPNHTIRFSVRMSIFAIAISFIFEIVNLIITH